MAYHHSQGAHGASCSQGNEENQEVTSSSLPSVSSSRTEQAFGATSPLSGFQSYGQGWNHEAATFSQEALSYYSHSGYPQSGIADHNFRGHSSFTPNSDAVAGSQENLAVNYTSSRTYPSTNYYGLPQTGSYQSAPGYNPIQPPRLNTSIAPAMSPYSAQTFSYTSPIASASASPPSITHHASAVSPEGSQADIEYSVPCPYRCGTVLTGVHALGNLTRHLKTQACVGSSRAKIRYLCPIENCDKEYARSDGLRVHMRRRHGAPPGPRKTDGTVDEDED